MPPAFIKEEHLSIELLSGIDVTDSYVRTWITREGVPYKYEFRGQKFQGYLNPEEVIIHG